MHKKLTTIGFLCLILSACGKIKQDDDNQSNCNIGGIKIYNNYTISSGVTLSGNIDGNTLPNRVNIIGSDIITVNVGNHSVQIYGSNGTTCYNNTVYVGACSTSTIYCPY
jgi:hypothetical protein